MNDKQHAARRLVEDHTSARRLVEDHTTDNPIDWQTLIESALLLVLVGMILWIMVGAR